MESTILGRIGIDPAYLLLLLFLIQVLLFVLLVSINMKYNRMKTSYASFMKGKDGKNLEESLLARFEEIDELVEISKENQTDIQNIYKKIKSNYQKIGIIKYDAFHEMGGNLSFALTMLDENNNGWILNAMHSREGCYTYIKEIVNGQSYIELAEEESESLERAIYQENYDLKKS
ncbi:DUF4446 family protein [Muricomes intestini]|uniref:Uncharacterized protein DUF4446 n=1 Tax=Muricomes intestini TaxID=1796634 RepID=A0A4R3K925_9FIRM|nr:DUF4446 family protein [Muricomes intestini]TCS79524.1 uncharacterized protein DUF4446 [Muricomes intestini]HAX53477.1 DUF4446 domain-containing protein [Lachnospiraceae bacterium]HCR84127.1 DUF4446 domain-containing protein [Lachnospiraceae bacterium]